MGQTLYIHRYIGQRYNSFCCTRQKCGSHLKDRAKIEGRYSSIPQRRSKNNRRTNSKAANSVEDYSRENYPCRFELYKFIIAIRDNLIRQRKEAYVCKSLFEERRF